MANDSPRILVLGAHPDDAEFHAGALLARQRQAGAQVRIVSVTNGAAGHHRVSGEELVRRRRAEAAAAGKVIGAEYMTWDFPDGALTPSLEVREAVIREIRAFAPDMVLTHRPHDYHPDHRAVGQAVQDASYMVTVPPVVPEAPALRRDPIVAYMVDLFSRPSPLRPDVTLDATAEIETVIAMLDCHQSQVYEWLPYHDGVDDQVPDEPAARKTWLRQWVREKALPRAERFRDVLKERFGAEVGGKIEFCEIYEISEYAAQASEPDFERLFPGGRRAGAS